MRSSLADYVMMKARDGQRRVECPECGPQRKTKGEATLSVKNDGEKILWHCWHCETSGAVPLTGQRREVVNQPTKAPIVVPMRSFATRDLDEAAVMYLLQRGISADIAKECGVVSGDKFFRKHNAEVPALGFIYRHKNQDYAVKWRSLEGKDFTQDGSAQTLYLADRLVTNKGLVITEGEADALSYWQAGIKFAVSIPSGAVQAGSSDESDSLRLRWMQHHDDLLSKVQNIFLAVDMDGPGQTTANELARRLGKAKCWKVAFPEGCKDANETLVKHGPEALAATIATAKPWPIEGIATPIEFADKVSSLYTSGLPRGLSTGWQSVDELFTLNPGNLVIVTGTPGGGKSTFLDALLVNAMKLHDWRVAYASFENPPDVHISKLIAQKVQKPFGLGPTPRMSETEMLEALGWVNERVTLLTHDGAAPTVASLIERFETAVRRQGTKACVVDPFNFLKLSSKKDGGVDTESINEMLSEFKMFAQRAEVVFFLVAHPAKPMGGSMDQIPTGYSISGCHDDKTEVLTSRGWKSHQDITLDDVVACFDLNDSGLKWERPSVVHRYPHSGEMHHYTGYSMDLMVTPSHRMVVKNYWAAKGNRVCKETMEKEPWRFVTSDGIPSASHLMPLGTLPQDGGLDVPFFEIGGVKYAADDFLRAVGWFIAEGWTAMKAPSWCQAVGPLQQEMSSTLRRLRFPFTETISTPHGKGRKDMWKARVLRKQATELSDWFSENCGVGCANKKLPSMVFDLCPRQLNILLHALVEGDGSFTKKGMKYFTTSKKLADQVQEISIRCGMAASVADYGAKDERHMVRYVVNINSPSRKVRTLIPNNNRSIVQYDGEVFCLTVPTGAYITRRNGAMAIAGNSAHFFNRADFGLTMHRKDGANALHIWKARFSHQGSLGSTPLTYDSSTGGFIEAGAGPQVPTDRSWLDGLDNKDEEVPF